MRRMFFIVVLYSVAAFGSSAAGQSQTPPESAKKVPAEPAKPVELKRVPPSKEAVPDPNKYPFEMMLNTLEQGPAQAPIVAPVIIPGPPTMPVSPSQSPGEVQVPKNYHPPKEGPLSETGKEALAAGQGWLSDRNPPATGRDGRVLFTYGAGLPTVICAPLRICTIELQPGEHLTGEPHIGDSVRWDVSPAVTGTDAKATSMIVIKPRAPGLDTNLLLTTDRRAYYLRLVSRSEDYVARVGFEYPEDNDRWKEQLAREAEAHRKEEFEASRITPVESIENLYFDYRIQGGDENMRPVRVVDDGRKTYIQMTPNATVRELPILVVLGPGGAEMVNYRVKGDMYIVDRLFERGALILGAGKKAQRAEIFRGTYDAKRLAKIAKQPDPYAGFKPEEDNR